MNIWQGLSEVTTRKPKDVRSSEATNYIHRWNHNGGRGQTWNKELVSNLLEVLNKCSLQVRGVSVLLDIELETPCFAVGDAQV